MMNDSEPSKEWPNLDNLPEDDYKSAFFGTTIIYLVLFMLGFVACYHEHKNLATIFSFQPFALIYKEALLGAFFSLGAMSFGFFAFLLVSLDFKHKNIEAGKYFKMMPLWQIGFIAIFGALSEELFLRGAIQTNVGLLFTSLIYAVFHISLQWQANSLFLWTLGTNLCLGYLYLTTGSILPGILVHSILNVMTLLYSQNVYREAIKKRELQKNLIKNL